MASINASEKFHLKRFIKELEKYRAPHTEFVSVYVPSGYDLDKIVSHLRQEQGTAANIKSSSTRKNVIDALEKMLQRLKLYKRNPDNGLAIFSGNLAAKEGKTDLRVWDIEPPLPVGTRLYRCDKNFHLDILRDLCETHEFYGLVVMDARDSHLAILKGKRIVHLAKMHSHVPGKFKAGGQSALRFSHNRDLAIKDHMKKTAELMKEQFLKMSGLKGILVGGPGPIKYELVDSNFITGDLKKKILGVKDLSYTEEIGLQELVDKSEDILAEEEIAEEKKMVGLFLEKLARSPELVAYGEINVRRALSMGAVDILLLSESLDEDVIDELETIASQFNSSVKIISVETKEGAQLRDIGKLGAILRFAI
jgi:peptide chain release factor subunit 1